MYGNDISNATPPRLLVHVDVVTVTEQVKTKKWKVFNTVTERRIYDRYVLNRLLAFASKNYVSLELVFIGVDQAEADKAMEYLEAVGIQPFRWAVSHKSIRDLVAELPYRTEVQGVIDLQERGLMYGSYYFPMNRI